MTAPTARSLAAVIDHTLLKPEATERQVEALCDEAVRFGFAAVCVAPIFVARAVRRLSGTDTAVVSVAGFPLGTCTTTSKVHQARQAMDEGAREIDMVVRLGDLIAGHLAVVREDIAAVAHAVHAARPDGLVKVILETAVLTDEQIALGCRCCLEAGADFVKTSTGFHPAGGASLQAVRTLRRHAGPMKVKAAGGIRDLATALAMLQAGADRLGTSAGVRILSELRQT